MKLLLRQAIHRQFCLQRLCQVVSSPFDFSWIHNHMGCWNIVLRFSALFTKMGTDPSNTTSLLKLAHKVIFYRNHALASVIHIKILVAEVESM